MLEVTVLPQKKSNKKEVKSNREIIRDMNLKVTSPRLLILDVLSSGRNHITAQEVFEKVMEKDSTVGFATVYRFLRHLSASGYVSEVRMGGMSARYEMTPAVHHDHLTCTQCGKINEFANEEIESLQELVARQLGYILTNHVLELYGICRDCQQRKTDKIARKP